MNNSRNGFGDIQARARILFKIDRLMLGIKGNENQLARETGLRRESLYKALSAEGNPEFATILKVVNALGLRLRAESARGMMHKLRCRVEPELRREAAWVRLRLPRVA